MTVAHDLTGYLQALPNVDLRVPLTFDHPDSRAIATPSEILERLRDRLLGLPRMVGGNSAAVLLLLYPRDGEMMVLMTRRASWLRNHPREVSFPGGAVEPGETLADAALRETFEEVGIHRSNIKLLGLLGSGAVRGSGRSFSGIVGYCETPPITTMNADEVEAVLEVPLGLVYTPDYFCEFWYNRSFGWGLFHFFVMVPDIIWGASARMLVELLALLE